MSKYTTGRQPCLDYYGQLDGNGEAMWTNEHDCYCKDAQGGFCSGKVSFCNTCSRDHHSNGFDTCVCAAKAASSNPTTPGNTTQPQPIEENNTDGK